MIVSKITPILEQTAALLNMEQEEVNNIIKHTLQFTKDYMDNPTAPGIRLPYLGVFRPYIKSINYYLSGLISKLRDPDLPEEEKSIIRDTFRKI